MIDTHCHLDDPAYAPDRDAVLARAAAAGVVRCVTIGTDLDSSRRAVELARTGLPRDGMPSRGPQISAAVGVHPHAAASWTGETAAALEQLAAAPGVVAIGEVGLDYSRPPQDAGGRLAQQAVFRESLAIARRRGLPVIIHCREAPPNGAGRAWEDCFAIVREMATPPIRAVLHCFSGGESELRTALDLGCVISLAGNLTFKHAEPLRAVARRAPLDRLVVETDAPYLAPSPHRGHRNEPAYVVETAQVLAQLQQVSFDEVARRTSAAAAALFGWDHVAA